MTERVKTMERDGAVDLIWVGAGIVMFRDGRIGGLNEYEMKREKHDPYKM